jgi:uncharacterized protein (TIGR03435 family)
MGKHVPIRLLLRIHLCNLPIPTPAHMLKAMRALCLLIFFVSLNVAIFGQAHAPPPSFDVASVKPCQQIVGPDYNNQFTYSPDGLAARHATLKRLIAEAYGLQMNQVSGPNWLDQNEYDIDARAGGVGTRVQIAPMLRTLLAARFNLVEHNEVREMRMYELVVGKSGPRIHALKDGEAPTAQPGFHFHGDMRQFADLLALQLSIPAPQNPSEPARAGGPQIPVVDKTGLPGIFDFSVDMRPDLGTDMFTAWQRALRDQLGLGIESRKGYLAVLVVDSAAKEPTEN